METEILEILMDNLDNLNPEIKQFIINFLKKFINKFNTSNYYIFYENENKQYLVNSPKNNTEIDIKNSNIANVTDLTEYIDIAKKIINNIDS